MMLNFTCPHCGKRATSTLGETDIEYVDLGNGLPDAIFPALPPGVERHIDMRLCCAKCYDRAGERLPAGAPHPYEVTTHVDRLRALDAAHEE
jgi:hypothetical protein